jgi:hypothetical protein
VTEESAANRFMDRVQALGVLITPPALLTGLLYYFATVREQAVFGYFGINPSMIEFSTREYLTRSVGVMFLPLAAVMFAGLAAVIAHVGLVAALDTPPARRRRHLIVTVTTTVLGVAAALLLTTGLVRLTNHHFITGSALAAAIALGAGALVAEYAFVAPGHLRARHPPPPSAEPPPADAPPAGDPPTGDPPTGTSDRAPLFGPRLVIARRALVGGVLVIAVFWATTVYANNRGVSVAKNITDRLATERGVVLYSSQRLQITGPAVTRVDLDDRASAYRFRYDGLHLLIRSSGRLFLLPTGWRHGAGAPAIVVTDDPASVRLDFLS